MTDRRENATFSQLTAGHSVHIDAPADFAAVVRRFLET